MRVEHSLQRRTLLYVRWLTSHAWLRNSKGTYDEVNDFLGSDLHHHTLLAVLVDLGQIFFDRFFLVASTSLTYGTEAEIFHPRCLLAAFTWHCYLMFDVDQTINGSKFLSAARTIQAETLTVELNLAR